MVTKNELTIATYNIQFAFNREEIIENIVKMAKEEVVLFCLQEIVNDEEYDEFIIDAILNHLGNGWQAEYYVGNEKDKGSIGTAILWKKKLFFLKKTSKILLPKVKHFAPHEKFYYKVVGVPAEVLQRRSLSCIFSYQEKEIRVTSVHIDNIGGPKHRMKQLNSLIAHLARFTTPLREIICGDFNTFDLLKTGYEKKTLQKKLIDFDDASKHIDWTSDIYNINFSTSIKFFPWFIKTFNVHIRRRLDYIWVKHLKVLTIKKLPLSGSDHYPIIAKLKFE